jgi:hypothetical protein
LAEQGQKENQRGGSGHRLLDHVRSPSASPLYMASVFQTLRQTLQGSFSRPGKVDLPKIHLSRRCAMYACIHEPDSGFFGGVCAPDHRPRFSCDPPHHPAIREWYCASTRVWWFSPQRIFIHRSNIMSLARRFRVKNRPLPPRRGTRPCMRGDMGFGESTFPGGGWMKWREGPNRPFRSRPGEDLGLSRSYPGSCRRGVWSPPCRSRPRNLCNPRRLCRARR